MDPSCQFRAFFACLLSLSLIQLSAQTFPVENTNTGDAYMSIAGAIEAASDGDVVMLNALTFNETLSIQKPLTLKGDAGGGTRARRSCPMEEYPQRRFRRRDPRPCTA